MTRRTAGVGALGAVLAVAGARGNEVAPGPAIHLAPADRRDRLRRLADWVAASFVADGIDLVPNLPDGRTRAGTDRDDLRRLFWLQNCNLFAFHALRPYAPELAARIEASYWKWYRGDAFKDVEERTEHYLALGKLPARQAPEGQFFRIETKIVEQGNYRVGTELMLPDKPGMINDNDPRGLLKFGALGASLRGDAERARGYFDKALKLWDGDGFTTTRMERHQAYYTRYLAYVLIAARATGAPLPPDLRAAVEARLWAAQDADGGLWTNYMADGSFPAMAKKTNEIGPLTLLAYDESLWAAKAR